MKKIHYKNIGFPKTGTTWLYKQLCQHHDIDGQVEVRFKEYQPPTEKQYKNKYENFNVSFNLNTHSFMEKYWGNLNYCAPWNIHNIATHITMIIRNPYDQLNSYINYDKNTNPNSKLYIYFNDINNSLFKSLTNFEKIFNDWDKSTIPVKYMFYDDLVNDNVSFFYDICDYLGIRKIMDHKMGPALVTDKKLSLPFDNREMIDYINSNISLIEQKFNRDLSHWKKL